MQSQRRAAASRLGQASQGSPSHPVVGCMLAVDAFQITCWQSFTSKQGLHLIILLTHSTVTMQRQALQDFKPRMAEMTEQSRQQHAAARAAATELHTAQMALQAGQADVQELQEEKQSLQQLADTMQQSLASNSQVWLPTKHSHKPVLLSVTHVRFLLVEQMVLLD